MKKTTFTLIAVLAALIIYAQSPQAFKYQAMARNNSGEILTNQDVAFQISILQGSTTGSSVYVETHDTITSEFGLVNLEIGNGDFISGGFTSIDWGTNSYFLKVEMDENGGSNYQLMGISQLLSVPYALYSETTGDTTRWRKINDHLYYDAGKVGIGTTNPSVELDISGADQDDGTAIQLRNYDNTHRLLLFGGQNDDPNPFIHWKAGDPLRFTTDEGGWSEKMRITSEGQLGIGTSSPERSAILELNSSSKGFLLPKMTSEQIINLQFPTSGLQVYNTDNNKVYVFVEELIEWKELSYGTSSISTNSIFEIGTGGGCDNTTIYGIFKAGVMLTTSNFVDIEVNVLSVGDYTISTDTINGYTFRTSGIFSTTGTKIVTLFGYGMPQNAQPDLFTITGSNDSGSCTFTIIVLPNFANCGDLLTDIDGNTYNTVEIGIQCWTSKNLRTTIYSNGTPIPNVTDSITWGNLTTGAYVWPNNDISWKDKYGALYNWHATIDANGLCPNGWHVSTHDEWTNLTDYIGGTSTPHGNELKSCRQVNSPIGGDCETTEHPRWEEDTSNGNYGTDDYSFSSLPGGCRYYSTGIFVAPGSYGYWWSSTESSSSAAWARRMSYNLGNVSLINYTKEYGLSARCVKD